eukprot:9342743-Alexandrium_andersonii.AAC.1
MDDPDNLPAKHDSFVALNLNPHPINFAGEILAFVREDRPKRPGKLEVETLEVSGCGQFRH